MNRVEMIRAEEKKYHDFCYENNILFEPGSWLHRPVKSVLDVIEEYNDQEGLSVLDLGSGVGRNSIPIAQSLIHKNGKVVCVDLLESAIDGLIEYGKKFGVEQVLDARLADIEAFRIVQDEYDVIVAVSTLEHLSSKEVLKKKLEEMILGTKLFGSNCLIINGNIKEEVIGTKELLDPMFELNIATEELLEILQNQYKGWEIKQRNIKKLEFNIERNGRPVRQISDCITFIACRVHENVM